MRIVLAAEEMNLRLALQLLLSEEPGAKIIGTASDDAGALALIESSAPDLVLLDWELPGTPVQELLPEIGLRAAETKVIVLGKGANVKKTAMQAGADAFVIKGEPPGKLLETYRSLCDNPDQQTHPEINTETIEQKG